MEPDPKALNQNPKFAFGPSSLSKDAQKTFRASVPAVPGNKETSDSKYLKTLFKLLNLIYSLLFLRHSKTSLRFGGRDR